MRFGTIFPTLVIGIAYLNSGFGAPAKPMFSGDNTLPWHVIAKEYFNTDIHIYPPGGPVIVNLSGQTNSIKYPQKTGVNIDKYIDSSWFNTGQLAADIKDGKIEIDEGISEEGFYKLSCPLKTRDGTSYISEFYIITCGNWKRDILTFCRAQKEQIEINPDPQLIRSTIAASHFDHAMEMISRSSVLSKEILDVLNKAILNKREFESGKYPNFVKGLNKIKLRRFKGANITEFVVYIPDEYDPSRKWPLFLHPDPRRSYTPQNYSEHSGFIDCFWHFPMPMEFDWKDYEIFRSILYDKIHIDENRLYIYGDCGNGIAAMALALKYPDQWAECSAILGNSHRNLAGNALNLPVIFTKGQHNEEYFLGYFNFAVECFQYFRCRHFQYSQTHKISDIRGDLQPNTIKVKAPERISFTIESLSNPTAYWVKIDGREDENFIGTVDVNVEGQNIYVKTDNVDAYSLNLIDAPLDANRPVEIIENEQSLGLIRNSTFTKRSEKYINATLIKNKNLHGPVWDVFTDPYVVVWGSSNEEKTTLNLNKKIAASLTNNGPLFSDSNMPAEFIKSHNLILIGTVHSNRLLLKIKDRLPIQIEESGIIAKSKLFKQSDIGFIFIYPNPLNPEKYLAVFSGTSTRALENIYAAYTQIKEIRPVDIGIFEVTESGGIKWHIIEKFNTVWDWHNQLDQALFTIDKIHPKWQWHQWAAKIIKKQMKADVVVCENPFMLNTAELSGDITYRDLFNTFQNLWFIKLRMDGKTLKSICTVPLKDISKRDVQAPIFEGINIAAHPVNNSEKVLSINELVDNNFYTVALPEKCINGQRIGILLQDYTIADQAYLIPILYEYLLQNINTNVEAQLDSLRFNLF